MGRGVSRFGPCSQRFRLAIVAIVVALIATFAVTPGKRAAAQRTSHQPTQSGTVQVHRRRSYESGVQPLWFRGMDLP